MSLNYLDYPVLYVDDELSNLSTVSYALEDHFAVMTSSSADEALRLLAEQDVAVLLADYKMPDMDGAELCARAQEMRPDTVRIIVTAFPDLHLAMEAINRGRVSRYLTKPFKETELVDALRSAIDVVHLHRSVRSLELRVLRSGSTAAASVANVELTDELDRNARAILTALQNAADLLQAARHEASPDARMCDLLDAAQVSERAAWQGAEDLRKLVERLRRGSAQKPAPTPRCVVTRAVETVVRTLRPEIQKIGKLQVQIDGEPIVAMEPSAFGQVLTHLLFNAAQALRSVAPATARVVVRVDAAPSEALVSVSDTGVGIAPEDQERIFDPFFSTQGRTGLGLAIARELVSAAGGRIEVSSVPGEGSTFTVRLPMRLI
jgi:signal transduction histidine kinase